MSVYLDASLTIQKAASRARGDRYEKLLRLCDQQKSVSTRKLLVMIEDLLKSDRLDALHFKALADFVRDQTKIK